MLARHGVPWGKTTGQFEGVEAVAYLEEYSQQEQDAYDAGRGTG